MEEKTFKLWENGAPLFNPDFGQEPSITFYPCAGSDNTRGSVIVIPGGGYSGRCEDHEGIQIVRRLHEDGFHAFILHYRCAPYCYPAIMYDVQRAVRFVRYNFNSLGINPDKIATLGFSAGGNLATLSCEQFDYGKEDGDEIDRVSCRPDAAVLCYAVISLYGHTHNGTRDYLLRGYEGEEREGLIKKLSGETAVREDMPPVFFWHNFTDEAVNVLNPLLMAAEMKKKELPFEMHVYPHGWHGMGLAVNDPVVSRWTVDCAAWLRGLGF